MIPVTARPVAIASWMPGTASAASSAARAARITSSPVVRATPKTAIMRRHSVGCATPPWASAMAANARASASSGDDAGAGAPSRSVIGDARPAKSAVITRRSSVEESAADARLVGAPRPLSTGPLAGEPSHAASPASTSATSRAESGRSSGCLLMARPTSSSSAAGTPGSASRRRGASWSTIFATTAKKSSPVYGRRPARSSKITTPNEKMSARCVTRASPRACSGAM